MTAEPSRSGESSGDQPPPVPPSPPPEGAPAASATAQHAVQNAPQNNTSGFHVAVHERHHVEQRPTGKRLAFLSLTALGIVYGDIGTSPLYALQQVFASKEHAAIALTRENVLGVLSLIIWLLVLVVSVKYIIFIMRADNRGEGGVFALMALILQKERREADAHRRYLLVLLGLFGAALLYGDGIITPAISVLSAMEGLKIAMPSVEHLIIPLSAIVLFTFFMVQKLGTGKVGAALGPIMCVWFLTLGVLGIAEIAREPRILFALNPVYGVRFFLNNGGLAFLALGAIVLAVTGAEALYADMGHFGKRPIRVAWFSLVLPALFANYLGQGALLLRNPAAIENPFYLLAPKALLIPLVILATIAAVIASQALISGAFSLTQQAVQLGYSPRVTIVHTSWSEAGQVFIPEISRLLMIGCLLLVFLFRSSQSLGAAYGIAVTGTMTITSILFGFVARSRWNWPYHWVLPLTAVFLTIDVSLLAANIIKIEYGGWVPIVVAICVFTLMSTWKKGRILLNHALNSGNLPLDLFLDDVAKRKPTRVSGTAVFMTSSNDGVPVVLLHHIKHNKVLHDQVILMSVVTLEVPEVKGTERVTIEKLGFGFYRVVARYGFMETPNVPEILQRAREAGIKAKMNDTTFYLGRERVIIAEREKRPGSRRSADTAGLPRMARWRKKIFVIMTRNARSATEFFGIPPNRVVEMGAQVEF